ncbi:MAG TPA: TlpA disulfide reductase family protein [Candidatus Thermoplasmatota archaeon]|nr:TlpA disulfide reductase family protein [Candidatus Thermoplasmatota archaeon]
MRTGAILAIVGLLALAGCLSGGSLTGKPSPRFAFVTSEGVYVNETTYLGQWVILDLMATWCGPCKLEVAHLRDVQAVHGDKVVILSVDVDPQETIRDLEAFESEYGASWPYAIDRDGNVKLAMEMRIIPKLVILDPEGNVAFEREGEVLPAAIHRVIDPSLAPAPWLPLATAGAGIALGFAAALNPYRRAHRDGPGGGPTLAALGVLAASALLAWPFAGLVSTRATYGSLLIGAIAAGAALWWLRARRTLTTEGADGPNSLEPRTPAGAPLEGPAWQRASDRGFELGAGFAGAMLLALVGAGGLGFAAPLLGFFAGALAGYAARARLAPRVQEAVGVVGLALTGAGLLAFGARILLAQA